MKSTVTKLMALLVLPAMLFSGCSDGNGVGPDANHDPGIEIPAVYEDLPGELMSEDETWSSDTTLTGPRFGLPGVTLTVEAGGEGTLTYHNNNTAALRTIITLP